MKKIISLLISFAMLLSVIPTVPSFAEDEALFFEDSFENGMDNWVYVSKLCDESNAFLTEDKAFDGKNAVCLKDTFTDNMTGFKTKNMPVTEGYIYKISGAVFHADGSGGTPYLNFFNEEGKKIGGVSATTTAKNTWTEVTNAMQAPKGAKTVQVLVIGGSAAVGTSYIDKIKVTEQKSKIIEYPDDPDSLKDGDLMFSDNFEDGTIQWRVGGAGADGHFTLENEYFTEGSHSLRTKDTNTDNATSFMTVKIPISPSQTYTVLADTMVLSGDPAKIVVRLFNKDNQRITSLTVANSGRKSWGQSKLTFTTTADTVSYEIYIATTAKSVGEGLIDNIRLYKGTVEQPADYSKASTPDLKNVDFTFKDTYEMPEFKPTIGHPRVYFNKDDIETIKKNASHPQNASAYKQLLKEIASTADGSLKSKEGNNLNSATMGIIQAKAFYYAVWGDETKGREAISMLHNFLDDANPYASEYNAQGYLVFTVAAVYDWCYPLLTKEDMRRFQNGGMEAASTTEAGFPPVKGSVVIGHSAEAMILRDQMAFALAVYDERPDIYKNIAGRYFEESVPSVRFLADGKSSMFGNSYANYRYQWEVINAFMMDAVGIPKIFGDNHQYTLYWNLYARRPDGSMIHDGDSVSQNQTMYTYDERGTRAYFLAGNYYKDPYLKGEALRHNNGIIIGENSSNQTLSSIEVLCFNDPAVEYKSVRELPLSYYAPAPRGEMIARTSWAEGQSSPAVVAQMKVDEYWTQGHDHVDSGEFEIYYKGALANDTGYYQAGREGSNKENTGNTVYGTVHFYNYQIRTIAHNCMLVFNPDEDVKESYMGYANDGGQIMTSKSVRPINSQKDISEDLNRAATVMGREIGTDTVQPDYTYIKGDLAKGYGEKVPGYERSMMFLNLKNSDTPAAMVVFDRVVAKDKGYEKKWVLHGLNEPQINGTRTVFKDTREGYNGKLTVDTLLPKADNLTISTIGGKGQEYLVNGIDYWAQTLEGKFNEGGGYRIEVSPKEKNEEDYFLNVLQVADADSPKEPLASEMIEALTHTGVKIADRVVLFGKEKDRVSSEVSFTVSGEGNYKYTVADLTDGTWQVKKDGVDFVQIVATKDGGVGSFEGTSGNYTLTYLGAYGEKVFTSTPLYTDGINIKLEPQNRYVYSDVEPFIQNGRTLVPMRAIFEALEANVSWDDATATATGEKDGTVVKITRDSDTAYVNGKEYKLDAPAQIKDGRFVVPVRFIAESFGVTVDWDAFSKTVLIQGQGAIQSNVYTGEFISKHNIPNALPVYKIEQSGDDGAGDTIAFAFDNIMSTNWAVKEDDMGNPGWGIFDLGSVKTIDSISTAYMRGGERKYTFSVYVSEDGVNYTLVKDKLQSPGTGLQLDTYDLGGVKGRYVKYVGYGNTANSWNSITEIVISGK